MPQLMNFTKMTAGFTNGLLPDAREVLVVVVKGTFVLPINGGEAQLADEQLPLVDSDTFSGEPGYSSTVQEVDYAPYKPRCDILLNGSAYTPGGRPAQRVSVALRVGNMSKAFSVVGPRVWTQGLAAISPSEPQFFMKLPISYDNAFGGIDSTDPEKPRYFAQNHAGKGFSYHMNLEKLIGQPVPNTEEIDNPIANPRGNYRPMAFGAIGRGWEPRCKFAGTYDKHWLDNVFPFLPEDFRNEYYQAAPTDQQTSYLKGGEEVSLLNLTPDGNLSFQLPVVEVPVLVYVRGADAGEGAPLPVVCDTLFLEPDQRRFTCTWRGQWPLKQDLFEVEAIIVGRVPRAVQLSTETFKPYYRSLGEYISQQQEEPA